MKEFVCSSEVNWTGYTPCKYQPAPVPVLHFFQVWQYEKVMFKNNLNPFVRDVDNDYPIDRFSGGGQDDIAIALRIALSRYLAGLHQVHESTVLIFDEIFASQDEERRNNLLTALRTQESRFPQESSSSPTSRRCRASLKARS
jgi:hypothetical protein